MMPSTDVNLTWKLEGKDIPLDAEFLKDVAPTEKQKTTGQVLRGQVHDPLARIANRGISGNAGVFTTADDIGLLCAMLQISWIVPSLVLMEIIWKRLKMLVSQKPMLLSV